MVSTGSRPWVVAVFALVFAGFIAVNSLNASNWDPTVFVGFGEEAVETTEYAEARLGTVEVRRAQGHDGKFFFVQANDPWLISPANSASLIEPPVYRSQRMLYPALAGLGGLLGPEAIVWGLLFVNVIGLSLGTLGAARLALGFGASPWWGMAFAANAGLIFDLQNDGAGIVAACLAIWAVVLLYDGRFYLAIGMLAGAVLAREVMLVCVIGVSLWHWFADRRRIALATTVVPVLTFGTWYLYLLARLGPDATAVDAFRPPLVGIVRAIPAWVESPIALVAGVAVLTLLMAFVLRWWKFRTALGWAFIGFVPLALIMSERVWGAIYDFTRALAPALTAALLVVFVEGANEYRAQRLTTDVKSTEVSVS